MTNFSTALNKYKNSKGLTGPEMAKKLDVSVHSLYKYLDGKNRPNLAEADRILNIMGVSLVLGTSPKPVSSELLPGSQNEF